MGCLCGTLSFNGLVPAQMLVMDPQHVAAVKPVLRIWIRIHMFLGLLDPEPVVRGMDKDPDPSIIKQK
jgi:hypothetical protein